MLRSLINVNSAVRPVTAKLPLYSRSLNLQNTRFNSTSSASAVTEIQDLKHFTQVVANDKKVSVIDFYATWCGPCKAIAPIFDTLAQKIPEAEFARVDVDRAEDVAREYGITAMPTILFFERGEKASTIVGANVPQLIKTIQEYTGVDVKSR